MVRFFRRSGPLFPRNPSLPHFLFPMHANLKANLSAVFNARLFCCPLLAGSALGLIVLALRVSAAGAEPQPNATSFLPVSEPLMSPSCAPTLKGNFLAIKVINHLGDEVMKVFKVAD